MTRVTLLIAIVMLTACGGLKIEGECNYVREIKITYHCPVGGGTIHHFRVAPIQPD